MWILVLSTIVFSMTPDNKPITIGNHGGELVYAVQQASTITVGQFPSHDACEDAATKLRTYQGNLKRVTICVEASGKTGQ